MFSKKYRPRLFKDLVGQESNVVVLKEILKRGTVLPLIFTGQFGSGKTSASRVFAKAVLCKNRGDDQEPCGACSSCVDFEKDQNINYHEIDAASNGDVDSIRDLRDQVNYQAVGSRFKVTNIDEAHNITKQGYNALLKILEEGVSHHIFIFCTNEPEKMLETVRSRCWRIHSTPVTPPQLKNHLEKIVEAENVQTDEGVLELISKVTAPHIRDALNVMEFLSFNNFIKKEDVEAYFHLSENKDVISLIDSLGTPETIAILDRLCKKMDTSAVFDKILSTLLDLEAVRIKGKDPKSFLFSEDMERVASSGKDFLSISQLLIRIEKPVDSNFLKHVVLEASRLVNGTAFHFEVPDFSVVDQPDFSDALFSKVDVPSVESFVLSASSAETPKTPPPSKKSSKQGFHYEGSDEKNPVKHESNIDLRNQENYKLLRKRKDEPTDSAQKPKKQKSSDPLSEPVSFDLAERYLQDKSR
jgi:DNA polymerase III subunit gamma/tau